MRWPRALPFALLLACACGDDFAGTETDGASTTEAGAATETAASGGGVEAEFACDPVQADCSPQDACVPQGKGFACVAHNEDAGGEGEPCENIFSCLPGYFCLDGSIAEGCDTLGCCVSFCLYGEGADSCSGLSACRPYYSGPPPMGGEHIGVCAVG